jgi:hypothetical protein
MLATEVSMAKRPSSPHKVKAVYAFVVAGIFDAVSDGRVTMDEAKDYMEDLGTILLEPDEEGDEDSRPIGPDSDLGRAVGGAVAGVVEALYDLLHDVLERNPNRMRQRANELRIEGKLERATRLDARALRVGDRQAHKQQRAS